MISAIQHFFVRLFGGNSYFATFFISMVPLIELKGAIPFGMSESLFGADKLSPFSAFIAAATGALVPAFILLLVLRPLLSWLKNSKHFKKGYELLTSGVKKKAAKVSGKDGSRSLIKKYLGLTLFVAVPLPLTGAWTGSLIAAFLGLDYFSSLVCIFIGNLIAGAIVTLLCTIFVGYEGVILAVFLAMVLVALLAKIVAMIISRIKLRKNKN